MRIRWRGLELPSEVVMDEGVATEKYGRFVIRPFERGFGTTVGNSLRRILLSSLEGAAVTSVKIKGADHEFASLNGVLEDVTDIILNVKGLIVKLHEDGPRSMSVTANRSGEVRAHDIQADAAIEILNPDHLLATLTDNVDFQMEMTVGSGRGFDTADENVDGEREIGVIPIDSVFSPVTRVRYHTEDTRVGQKTNYDKLTLEIWTKGSIRPENALVEAANILRKHLNPFLLYHQVGTVIADNTAQPDMEEPVVDVELEAVLNKSLNDLDLSVRAGNCLEAAKITTVGELVSYSEAELLKLRSFGKTSLREVKRKLEDLGVSLGQDPSGATVDDSSEMMGDDDENDSPPSPQLTEAPAGLGQ